MALFKFVIIVNVDSHAIDKAAEFEDILKVFKVLVTKLKYGSEHVTQVPSLRSHKIIGRRPSDSMFLGDADCRF